jgi:hypothetical protein
MQNLTEELLTISLERDFIEKCNKMETIQYTGRYKLDKDTVLKDPLVTITGANYNYGAMKVVLTCDFENNQYKHSRELDPATITSSDGLTMAQIKAIIDANLVLKKQP